MKRLLLGMFLVSLASFAGDYYHFNSSVAIDGSLAPPVSEFGTLQENGAYSKEYSIRSVEIFSPGLEEVGLSTDGPFTINASGCSTGALSCTATVSLITPAPGDYSATLWACSADGGHWLGKCASQTITAHVH